MEVETSTHPVNFQGVAALVAHLSQSGRVVAGKHEGTFFSMVTVERQEEKTLSGFFPDYTDNEMEMTVTVKNEVQYVVATLRKVVVESV